MSSNFCGFSNSRKNPFAPRDLSPRRFGRSGRLRPAGGLPGARARVPPGLAPRRFFAPPRRIAPGATPENRSPSRPPESDDHRITSRGWRGEKLRPARRWRRSARGGGATAGRAWPAPNDRGFFPRATCGWRFCLNWPPNRPSCWKTRICRRFWPRRVKRKCFICSI